MSGREKYILTEEDVQGLLAGYFAGTNIMYDRLKERAASAIDKQNDVDELLMDQADGMLARGREVAEDCEENKILKEAYYSISFILRHVAHGVYRNYAKKGRYSNSDRFLRLVSYNEHAPLESPVKSIEDS